MSTVTLKVEEREWSCRELAGSERLGEATDLHIELSSPEPLERGSLLGKACSVVLDVGASKRAISGVITRVSAIATSQSELGRVYKLRVRSRIALAELRRQSRIFQRLSALEILRQVAEEAGYAAVDIQTHLAEAYEPREYVVQYDESDASFVRRLCEEEGIYFRIEAPEGVERLIFEDTSTAIEPSLAEPLMHLDESNLEASRLSLWGCRTRTRRRPGKVTLRDYDFEHPAVTLEGVHTAGDAVEQEVEVYEGRARFTDPDVGAQRAKLRLESLRAEAAYVSFTTDAVELSPGLAFSIDGSAALPGTARPEGDHLSVAIRHRWKQGDARLSVEVDAIALAVPYRLPRSTPRPRIPGVQTAIVTGASGQEIHTDKHGRIRLKFPWDRGGPSDDKSSLPVRVVHPNMPGSMLLPRVGWEVLTVFEDGDPERPYVIGRSFNAKQPPPVSLPANKTMTTWSTLSSPGGGRTNSIQFDDASGRQHVFIGAGFGKTTTVANNMVTQTAKNEELGVVGSQTRSVGANESISIGEAYLGAVGSQSATVGGTQKIFVTGHMGVNVGSETVTVGGAVVEKVGDPVQGALNLGFSAAMAGMAGRGGAGRVLAMAGGLIKGGVEGYLRGGAEGAARAVGMGALGIGAAMIPGGDALLAGVTGALSPAPWEEDKSQGGETEGGGGAGGAADASAAKGPGPGYRNTNVRGTMTEMIGAVHSVITPGSIEWNTTGASTFLVGGSHSTKARSADIKVAGASTETLGSLLVKSSGNILYDVKGALKTTVAGSLKSKAGGAHTIEAGASLKIKVGGSLTVDGSHVTFVCGSSMVSVSSSGVVVDAPTITITGKSKQAGKAGHS